MDYNTGVTLKGTLVLCLITLLSFSFVNAQDIDTLLFEDFEGAFLPEGWDTFPGGSVPAHDIDDWYKDTSGYVFNHADEVHNPHGYCAAIQYHNTITTHNDWLMTPAIYPSDYDSIVLHYYYSMRIWNTGMGQAYVVIDKNPPSIGMGDTLEWDDILWCWARTGGNWWPAGTLFFDLTSYLIDTDSFRIGWVYKRQDDFFWGIDDVKILAARVRDDTYSTFSVVPGWNLFSLPREAPSPTLSTLFPFTIPPAYRYSPHSRSYFPADTIDIGAGYWILSEIDTIIPIEGDTISAYTNTLYPGWNLIGALSFPISAAFLDTIPEIFPPPYGYSPTDHSYFIADFLYPGMGYWLLATDTVEFTLSF